MDTIYKCITGHWRRRSKWLRGKKDRDTLSHGSALKADDECNKFQGETIPSGHGTGQRGGKRVRDGHKSGHKCRQVSLSVMSRSLALFVSLYLRE